MQKSKLTLDFTDRKSPLSIRQASAFYFNVPIDREFTWNFLRARICNPASLDSLRGIEEICVIGMWPMMRVLPAEAEGFKSVLAGLGELCPEIKIMYRIK